MNQIYKSLKLNEMIDDTKNKSHSLINNLNIQGDTSQHPSYQQIISKLISNPKLTKIIKKVHTSIKDLQFITFQQFLQLNGLNQSTNDYFDKNDHIERYQTQLQRRIRQLQILLEMEHNHFQKSIKKSSSKKTSRCQILTPRQNNNPSSYNQTHKENEQNNKYVKFTSLSHQYQNTNRSSKKSNLSHRKTSLICSRYSRQNSRSRMESHKRIKQIQILQTYTQGRPYIQEYYNQIKNRVVKADSYRLNTMPSTSIQKHNNKSSRVGKIQKQMISKQSAENQYQNSFKNEKNRNSNKRQHNKTSRKQIQDNQYDMIPLKNQKLKQRLSRNLSRNVQTPKNIQSSRHNEASRHNQIRIEKKKQRQVCRQLITQVKSYEQINKDYLKKLKSIDKNNKAQRDKLLQASSRQKYEKKTNIQKLKNRIISKNTKKQFKY